MTIQKPMTLQEAKSIARHLGLTLRQVRSGNYRVNFRDGNETTAYYTDNLEDAVNTALRWPELAMSCRPSTRPSRPGGCLLASPTLTTGTSDDLSKV
jgi:hypothetical protein